MMQGLRNKSPQTHFRSGFTLVEMIVAGILLAAVMSLSVQMLWAVARQQRSADRRQIAAAAAANLLERITAQPYESISPEQRQTWKLDAATLARLPDAQLQITIDPAAGPPAGKQIALEIRWRSAAGVSTSPVRLTGWVFEPQSEAP